MSNHRITLDAFRPAGVSPIATVLGVGAIFDNPVAFGAFGDLSRGCGLGVGDAAGGPRAGSGKPAPRAGSGKPARTRSGKSAPPSGSV